MRSSSSSSPSLAPSHPRLLPLFSLVLANALTVAAQQPTRHGVANTFEIVGNSGVSAQQMFLGRPGKIYILDKTENNPVQVNGHPAWAVEYDVETNQIRPLDVVTNSFCAGGGVAGDGTWLNLGGNQAVTWGGNTADSQTGGSAPYMDADGGKSIRFLTPCDDQTCNWVDDPTRYMTTRRWYPTLEGLPDGSLFILGGNKWGGFVNDADQNNPTYEFYPSQGEPVGLNILATTLPANLFPFTFLLPSGNIFIQTNWGAEVFDYKNNVEYPFPNIPHAVRTYPASAGNMMLPLTPDNNYQATMLFCGGSDLEPDQWVQDWAIAAYPADSTCVSITPDVSQTWSDDDSIFQGRSMGNMIGLPDLKVLLVNGANTGVAGYGNVSWAIGHSYADNPLRTPLMYDPTAPAGSRWTSNGMPESTVNRMYHSGALLLPDGSVFIAGSNPNPDYIVGTGVTYPWEDRTERFYPWYYDKHRPEPQGLPSKLTYGGPYFNVTLSATDLENSAANIKNTKAVVIRTGFSTHAFNMGQRVLQLRTTYTVAEDGNSAVLHVSQLPSNANIFQPGPAMLFITVNGVPSIAQWITVGSGAIETQPLLADSQLPDSYIPAAQDNSTTGGNTPNAAVHGASGVGAGALVFFAHRAL
ncbi:glyoxal oxidase [Serendipita vermifera MAFF 305830]|uniref:Glyoxal oxidase n=1 Tax=Serendipita vermifera MAFF 305830 TaxID=933852 RepID=A0A0C2X3N1_SERVB|nr:glyoxal oxidase [Serendipita vermifera MAFF 305830]